MGYKAMLRHFCFMAAVLATGSAQAQTPGELLRERIKVPGGYKFTVFARDLGNPRLMQATPAGGIIVTAMRDGKILLVRGDGDGDGASDGTAVLRDGLDLPHGLLLEGTALYVAEEGRLLKFDFDGSALSNERAVLEGLPSGGNHVSRTLKRGPDGFLYLSIGSSCNSCIEDHAWRAAILRLKEGEAPTVYAQGLRNTVGFDWQPGTGALYGADNGRDLLGDDRPDDEVNLIAEGKHYGWPFVHGFGIEDPEIYRQKPKDLAVTAPVHGLGAHVAPLALRFLRDGSALVAEHGSWNRSQKAGYRIVRLVFDGATVREEAFLEGCEVDEEVICRPVDVIEAGDGSLYVSDDYAGAIYRIARSASK